MVSVTGCPTTPDAGSGRTASTRNESSTDGDGKPSLHPAAKARRTNSHEQRRVASIRTPPNPEAGHDRQATRHGAALGLVVTVGHEVRVRAIVGVDQVEVGPQLEAFELPSFVDAHVELVKRR